MLLADRKNSEHKTLQTMLELPSFGQENWINQKVSFSVQLGFCILIETQHNVANRIFEII